MRCNTMAAALVAALLMVGGAQAQVITWIGAGGTGDEAGAWRDAGAWDAGSGAQSALAVFGSNVGWRGNDAGAPADPHIIIDGPSSNVYYDQNTGTGGSSRDFQLRPQSAGVAGKLTISGGASLWMETNDDADPDGMWTNINGELLTVTGAGSLFRRAFGGSGSPLNQSAGKLQLRGDRKEPTGTTEVLLADGGRIENDGGQINFGKLDGDAIDSTVRVTIDGPSSIDSRGGGNFDWTGGFFGGAGNGSINFFRTWDQIANVPTEEDYSIDFTGHGGSITVDGSVPPNDEVPYGNGGILWIQQIGPDGEADYDIPGFLSPLSYEQMWTGVDRGTGGTKFGDVPAGVLRANGLSGATGDIFGDHFTTSGTAVGAGDYKVTMIREAGYGGTNVGDITGDGLVNAADAGAMFAGWSTGATPGTTIAEGDIAAGALGDGPYPYDDTVNAIDFGAMNANWTGDAGPVTEGTAAAVYNAVTGEIIVSADGVNNWYVTSATDGLTGAPPLFPNDDNGFRSDSDNLIGETALGILPGFADHSLGLVAQLGLLEGDLTIWSNAGVGAPLLQGMVERVPEPASLALIALGLCGVLATRRRLVA